MFIVGFISNKQVGIRNLCLFAIMILMMVNLVHAQDNGVISEIKYFEGAIHYKFSVSGKDAGSIYENNSIDLMTLFVKDGDYIVQLYGVPKAKEPFDPEHNPRIDMTQIFATTRLYIADSDRTFIVDAKNERYFLNDPVDVQQDTTIPVAVSNGDSVKILGIWCYGYKYVKKKETVIMYINPQYRVNTSFFKDKKNARINFLTKGLNGCIPLKIIRKNGDRTIENHATKIIPQKFSTEQFRIPRKFKRYHRDSRR